MKTMRKRALLASLPALAAFAALALALPGASHAQQAFPSKPIKILIGFPPGTIMDAMGRPMAAELSRRMGQPVVVENRVGANATIAARAVLQAEPDGYTLFFGNVSAVHPLLNKTNGVDASKELTPVADVAVPPFVLIARAGLPVTTFAQLGQFMKANPGKLTYGAPSATADMLMALTKARTGVEARGIPYKGSPQVAIALLADEVDLTAATAQSFIPQLRAGKMRGLFVMGNKRLAVLPDIPTTAELGIKDLELSVHMGFWAPPGMPAAIVQKLNAEIVAALATPSVNQAIRDLGAEPTGTSAAAQLKITEAENKAWAEAARLANFQPQ